MRCSMCSHESPAGSTFCLNCGSSLGQAYAPTQLAAEGLPAAAICGACRRENPPGMKYCRNCGTALAPAGPVSSGPPASLRPVAGPVLVSAGVLGGPLPGMPPAPSGGLATLPGAAAGYSGLPGRGAAPEPAGMPPVLGGPATTPLPPGRIVPATMACPRCGTQTPVGFAYCQQCGVQIEAVVPTAAAPGTRSPVVGGGAAGLVGGKFDGAIDPHTGTMSPVEPAGVLAAMRRPSAASIRAQTGATWGTVVLVNRDGSDGERFPLSGEYLIVGRAGADVAVDISFQDDRFLGLQHARIERSSDGAVKVRPLDALNGVFRKIDAPVELFDGAMILVGREVLRYEKVDPEEIALTPLVRHGVALFGSPPRDPWGRLMQIIPSGGYRDVRHLSGVEVVVGREEGDIVFRDDAFLSRRHAAVTWDGSRAWIADLGSSNGTFVRITGPTGLRHGDHVRVGDQLLRIELGR